MIAWNRRWIAPLVRWSIRRDLRTHLAGIWVRGTPPRGAAVLAPNHASWWDGYVLVELGWSARLPAQVMMTDAQLARFPFLRLVGAVGQRDVRPVRRGLRSGGWAVVFPSGEIRHPAQVGPLQPGAAWLAGKERAALVPVAVRVVLRGAQWPEAFVRVGDPCAGPELEAALEHVLAALEADLRAAPAGLPPAGYRLLMPGRKSRHDRVDLASRVLARLAGMRARDS